jgi:hypothetical protein
MKDVEIKFANGAPAPGGPTCLTCGGSQYIEKTASVNLDTRVVLGNRFRCPTCTPKPERITTANCQLCEGTGRRSNDHGQSWPCECTRPEPWTRNR